MVAAGGCSFDSAGKQSSVTKDISSWVTQAPVGVGLVSFGTDNAPLWRVKR
jgi:hypothetical protein